MRVKPAIPGAVIRDPHTKRPLPAGGAEVPDNTFWRRRLLAGEVVRLDAPSPAGNEPIAPLTTRARS
jgi:hypothetical protein